MRRTWLRTLQVSVAQCEASTIISSRSIVVFQRSTHTAEMLALEPLYSARNESSYQRLQETIPGLISRTVA